MAGQNGSYKLFHIEYTIINCLSYLNDLEVEKSRELSKLRAIIRFYYNLLLSVFIYQRKTIPFVWYLPYFETKIIWSKRKIYAWVNYDEQPLMIFEDTRRERTHHIIWYWQIVCFFSKTIYLYHPYTHIKTNYNENACTNKQHKNIHHHDERYYVASYLGTRLIVIEHMIPQKSCIM